MRNWTPAQNDAIYAHGGNILVSAAAGSGKTAVLVERVIQMITDKNAPVDIDKLLIVTFTNAAAAEMLSRITSSLKSIIQKDITNKNAQKQLSLIHNAKISTIDSFCINLVREYFYELGISSEFKILDGSEEKQIAIEAINSTLDKLYSEGNEVFLQIAQTFTKPDNDKDLIDLLQNLHSFIYAQPFPYKWFEDVVNLYDPNIEFENTAWNNILKAEISDLLDVAFELNSELINNINENDTAYEKVLTVLNSDKIMLEQLENASKKGLDALIKLYPLNFQTLRTNKNMDEDVKALLKSNRNLFKDILKNDVPAFFVSSASDYRDDAKQLYPMMCYLLDIIKSIDVAMRKIKDDKNSYSFSDIEHFAIKLLMTQDEFGNTEKTELAKELSKHFDEILVDEYQDTNEAQDQLFAHLSNGSNRFMVGDVKQSIYRFRLAMPQIFNEKRITYFNYDNNEQKFPAKIILDKNFRSRSGICNFVNHVFSLFMSEKIGELDYDSKEFLYPAADYSHSDIPCAQLKILDGVKGEDKNIDEATYIAKTILKKIKSAELVREGNTYRPIRYSDIAILMRSMKGRVGDYMEVFSKYGIPVVCENKSNLFENSEIQLLLALIRVINNPTQDIPIVTLMMSPIYGFSADEMANLRINKRYGSLYSTAVNSCDIKAQNFVKDIAKLRKLSVTMSTSSFIRMLIDEKHLFAFSQALGNGEQRIANLIKFIEIAEYFDHGTNVGMTAFVRYIDRIIESDYRTDSAPMAASSNDAVRIMTVHHSKGLEFPVCILAGTGGEYNFTSLYQNKLLLHNKYGLACKCHDEKLYCQYPSIPYAVIKNQIKMSMMSENLRVLYVAMTRAKEQFIVFAGIKNLTNRVKKLAGYLTTDKPNPYFCSKIYDDAGFIIMSALKHKDGKILRDMTDLNIKPIPSDFNFDIEIMQPELLEADIIDEKKHAAYDEKILSSITDKLQFSYSRLPLSGLLAKRTASSLDAMDSNLQFLTSSIPAFLNSQGMTPAEKGTATHTFMQYCDYDKANDNLKNEADRLKKLGYISSEQIDVLDYKKLAVFFNSDFADRIYNSEKVYREIKLSSFISAKEIEDTEFDEQILVQGIADCVFEEKNELVLVDYKTDYVKNENELLSRYKKQLDFYKTALVKTLGKPVKEAYLYSFELGKACLYK